MRKIILGRLLVMGAISFTACYAFAQGVISPTDFFTQVAAFVQSIGGLSTLLKISGVIMLIIASMKVTFLNTLIWSKLGSLQIWVAPVLGLIAGILSLGTGLTLPAAFAYISAGGGAVYMHEIMDLVKAIPGIGSTYVAIINFLENLLGGPAANPPPAAAQLKK